MRILLTVLLLINGYNSYAQECTVSNAKTESVSEYMAKMADSLVRIKEKFKRVKSLPLKKDFDATALFVAFKELKASYKCSSEMVGSYKESVNENISLSAQGLSQAYQLLATTTEQLTEDLKLELDGKLKKSPGEKAEKSAETMLYVKKNWELAIKSMAFGSYSAMGKENPKTKKIDNLIITSKERDAIVKTLKSEFILPLKKGDNDGIDVAADTYYQFLKQDWKLK